MIRADTERSSRRTARATRRLVHASALLLVWCAATPSAQAQSNEEHAEETFREGQRLLREGKTAEACELLDESQRAEPALGTLLNLAVCREKEGKIASAWRAYQDAAAWARRRGEAEREQFAREHALALEKILPRLPIDVADPQPEVAAKLGGPSVSLALENDAASLPPAESLSSARKNLAYFAGGAGIAALGAGVAFLFRARAFDAKSESEASKARLFSPPDPAFKAASLDDHAAGVTNQNIGIALAGAGAVGVGTALYVLLTAHEEPAQSATWQLMVGFPGRGADVYFTGRF